VKRMEAEKAAVDAIAPGLL